MQFCESTGLELCHCLKLEPNQYKPMTSGRKNELKQLWVKYDYEQSCCTVALLFIGALTK